MRTSGTRTPRTSRALIALFAGLLAPAWAHASQLVINGVPVGKLELTVQGVDGITFEKCTSVKIEAGDVKIDCPGYDLQAAAPPPSTESRNAGNVIPGRINRRYWLVTEQSQRGAAGFDIDLYVNAKWVRRFRNDDEQIVLEITKYMVPGKNKLLFAATKTPGARKSTDPAVFYRVVVGEGDSGGGNVMIETPLVEFKRTAAEAQSVTEEREIVGR